MFYHTEDGELVKVPVFVSDSSISDLHGKCVFHYNYEYDIGLNKCEYLRGLMDTPCKGCPNHPL